MAIKNKPGPPDWANRFLEWYCADDLLDEIQGDLLEVYEHRVQEKGLKKANWLFIKEVLLFFRPSSFKKKNPLENLPIMLSLFKSYFKTAARNIWKTKVFSGLNLIGLTVGFTSFLFIALYIQYESSFDQYHEKSNRIYRVAQVQKGSFYKGTDRFALAPSGLGPALTETFPEVEAATILTTDESLFTKADRTFYETGLFCDESLFDVFSFEVLEGNGPQSLKNPNSILITTSFVKKYFGKEDPIGKVLELENVGPLTVEGILKDPPKNSHFTFSYIASIKTLSFYKPGVWDNNSFYAYTALKEGYAPQVLEQKLVALDRQYLQTKDIETPITKSKFFLQPLKEIHLHSRLNFEIGKNGDIRYLYFFASIAIIILLIAAINYLNFAIADSERRATEVGMRKALGARRGQLVQQFLSESLLLTLISFLLANMLVFFFLPLFNTYLGQEIVFSYQDNLKLLALLLIVALLIGIGSGLYPAFFISRVAPMKALKGNIIGMYQKSNWLRNASVTGQFMAAIVLAIGSLVILQQLKYVQNKRLGYNEDQVLFVPYAKGEVFKQSSVIKASLLENPHIKEVAFSFSIPTNMSQSRRIKGWEGSNGEESVLIYQGFVDYGFMDLYDMEIIAGRSFSEDFPADSTKQYILNETAVESLGWDNAIGKKFQEGKVIGVVKDFHFQPLHLAIEPLFFELSSGGGLMSIRGNISLKVDGQNIESTINYLQSTMKSIVPTLPFEYQFLDEALVQMYIKERRLGRMFSLFTGLAVLISILGLLGLASYNVVRRSKEISIRKVLGASAISIVRMLFKDYFKLIVLALCIATPLSYYLMQRWLESFAYRITLAWQWQIYLVIGLAALILPLIIIGLQSIRSVLANPADNLKA
ncbi:MAG: ABC transporter permease [Saprospiraceae bacterium]